MADSIREALVAAMDAAGDSHTPAPIETGKIAADPQNVQEGEMSPLVDTRVETETQKADRLRDEAGRFAKDAKPKDATVKADPAAPAPLKAPSSWKKDYWEQFATLPPNLQQYVHEREGQFANGVSTYKQEAERSKPVWEALSPYVEDLQRYNISPAQWIQQVGSVHQTLVKGDNNQKLQTADRLLQSYNVPARLVTQDAQGQWQFVQQQAPQQQPAPQQFQPQDIEKIVEQKLEQRTLVSEIQQFAKSHPHYEAVRSHMGRLLDSGMAENLDDAYDKAILLNPAIREAEQQRLAQEKADQAKREAADRVNKARANAVSPRSDTPSGSMAGDGKKGLRANLEEAFDARESGRV